MMILLLMEACAPCTPLSNSAWLRSPSLSAPACDGRALQNIWLAAVSKRPTIHIKMHRWAALLELASTQALDSTLICMNWIKRCFTDCAKRFAHHSYPTQTWWTAQCWMLVARAWHGKASLALPLALLICLEFRRAIPHSRRQCEPDQAPEFLLKAWAAFKSLPGTQTTRKQGAHHLLDKQQAGQGRRDWLLLYGWRHREYALPACHPGGAFIKACLPPRWGMHQGLLASQVGHASRLAYWLRQASFLVCVGSECLWRWAQLFCMHLVQCARRMSISLECL